MRSTSQAGHLWLEHIPSWVLLVAGSTLLMPPGGCQWKRGFLGLWGQRGFMDGALTVVESPLLALPNCSSVSWWVMKGSGWWRRRVFPRLGHLLSERLLRISFAGIPGLGWQGKNEPIRPPSVASFGVPELLFFLLVGNHKTLPLPFLSSPGFPNLFALPSYLSEFSFGRLLHYFWGVILLFNSEEKREMSLYHFVQKPSH